MRLEAFGSVRRAAFIGIRRSRGVREAFARRSGRAFERRAFGSVRRRSEAFKSVRQRLACQRFLMVWAGHGMTR